MRSQIQAISALLTRLLRLPERLDRGRAHAVDRTSTGHEASDAPRPEEPHTEGTSSVMLRGLLERPSVSDVFGTEFSPPLSYGNRGERVDGKFIKHLHRNVPVLIYGPPGFGKTSLYRKYLKPDDYALVICQQDMKLGDYYQSLLGEYAETVEVARATRDGYIFKGRLGTSGTNIGGGLGGHTTSFEISAKNPAKFINDLARTISGSGKKIIVFEEFHRVNNSIMSELAQGAKTLFDCNKKVILVAAWRENRLPYDSHLSQHGLVEIDVGEWQDDELGKVIENGEKYLNIAFSPGFRQAAINNSFRVVTILQEICYEQLAWREQLKKAPLRRIEGIGDADGARILAQSHLQQRSKSYWESLRRLTLGYNRDTDKRYASLLEYLLSRHPKLLEAGIHVEDVVKNMNAPRQNRRLPELSDQAIRDTFHRFVRVQVEQKLNAVLFDYNAEGNLVRAVEPEFLAWLNLRPTGEISQKAADWYY